MDELLADEADPEMSADLARSVRDLERDVEKLELATLLGGELVVEVRHRKRIDALTETHR